MNKFLDSYWIGYWDYEDFGDKHRRDSVKELKESFNTEATTKEKLEAYDNGYKAALIADEKEKIRLKNPFNRLQEEMGYLTLAEVVENLLETLANQYDITRK